MTKQQEWDIAWLEGQHPDDLTFDDVAYLHHLYYLRDKEIEDAKREAWISWNDSREQKDLRSSSK